MLGIRDQHEYGECSQCGSIQILKPLENLAHFYPANYYSLQGKPESSLKQWQRAERAKQSLGKFSPLGWLINQILGKPYFADWLLYAGVSQNSAILDVGCGDGKLLRHLRDCGFRNLTGIDPFLNESKTDGEMQLLKQGLAETVGQYDLVMAHHSLEHMPQPLPALQQMAKLLKPQGYCLVRTPVAGTWAFQTYGADWVQLDAPRHLFIPSVKGMQKLALQSGLVLREIFFDSNRFQMVGSEKCKRELSFYTNEREIFSTHQLKVFDQTSTKLNQSQNGDQACFWFQKNQ
ncbi:class I SAM-dependent methyltransferase [Nostoc linckia FACHB-104]|nr:class I SAM-dependent methyltransferase [Nostoc linckia FACHB-104]